MDLRELCERNVESFAHIDGFYTGYVEGKETFEDFYTKLKQCCGFFTRHSEDFGL